MLSKFYPHLNSVSKVDLEKSILSKFYLHLNSVSKVDLEKSMKIDFQIDISTSFFKIFFKLNNISLQVESGQLGKIK